ncbi:MAG: CHASE2 domain-containing protein [Burkholderiales bacterium]|nr:CHASE2 domain-containing protein [Burkholderiales bacterium]
MKSFWKSDWFLGVVVVIAVIAFNLSSGLIPSLERTAYDLGVTATARAPSDKIAVIGIDKQSLDNIGRWPWSREVLAKMTDKLTEAKAKVIGYTVLFAEPQTDPGYRYVTKLLEMVSKSVPLDDMANPGGVGELARFRGVLQEAEQDLNTDRKLAESFKRSGNVVPMTLFTLGVPQGKPDKPLPDFLLANAVPKVAPGAEDGLIQALQVEYPIETIGKAAAALGHLNALPDVDGGTRTETLVLSYYGQVFPSLAMMIAAKSLNLGPADVQVIPGERVSLGKLNITTDQHTRMYTYFYKDREANQRAFPVDSFYDVFVGKIPVEKYRDKIVLIGPTAAGLGSATVTPVSPAMTPVETLAHTVSSILSEHFFVAPAWGRYAEVLLFLLVAAYLVAVLPRLKAGMALAISGGLFVAMLVAHFVLMTGSGIWIQFMLPATLLLVGHGALVSKRFIVTEAAKIKSDETSAESNRMLGIAYQAQGQLDLAWDKFRQVPMSDAVMDNMYNLALDFERKRQFNKAESVFRHMADFNPKFRDLETRLTRAKAMSETVILGGAASHPGGTVILPGGGMEKPMLGRYEVEKELGKGAMGIVYLGKDPKIGRVVAIKTMALSQEFEADELKDVKERFFREAETAGRLTHPNIVTIYDAGEEHDLAYIAMEFLKGKDLTPYTKADALLPLDRTLSIVARVAEALSYAHRNNVVHRDIKPANIMCDLEADTVKVTDFGIARITDSSKTKTGMVLGTPSYMSPEQLAGRKIEGRSDLFSLGVTLYQLCSGKLPFAGDSMAQLMYKIANEAPVDILTVNPGLPPAVVMVINKALAKQPEERYQTGDEMAQAIRAATGAGGAPMTTTTVDINL